MSDKPTETDMARVRLVLGFLVLIGIAVIGWGLVAPVAAGSAFAEVVIDELGLPKDNPETWEKLTTLYARSADLTVILGLLILVLASIGLWTARGLYS